MATSSSSSASSSGTEKFDVKTTPFHLEIHPGQETLAIATVDGNVSLISAAKSDYTLGLKASIKLHTDSCRMLCFDPKGDKLFTCGADCAIGVCDTRTAKAIGCNKTAHSVPINCIKEYDGKILVTGDDDGFVRGWDPRAGMKRTFSLEEHGDFVSDICCVEAQKTVLVTSGDGTLTTYDVRKGKALLMSDTLDDDLLSVVSIKDNTRVVCGSASGALEIFEWGMFGRPEERYLGHPESVDTICAVDEATICTGSSDGLIRIVSIQPNHLAGALGEHDGAIECVRVSAHTDRVYSCGHDNLIRTWSLGDDEDDEDEKEKNGGRKRGAENEEDDDDDDDSDDSDEPPKKRQKKKKKKGKQSHSGKLSKKEVFFDGL